MMNRTALMAGPGSSTKTATANLLALCPVSFKLDGVAATLAGFTVSLHPSAREVLIKYIIT